MTIDAIILSKTEDLSHYGLTCRTINSLRSSVGWDQNIIIVDSATKQTCRENGYIYDNCTTVHPECEFNYNKFLNIGISQGNADWVLICNNDLYFYKSWLSEMKKAIEDCPDVSSFSPISPTWHLHQDLPENYERGYQVSKHICGWCILLKREVIQTCDLFDEQFKFWYQDNDYALTLQKHGIKHALVKDSRVQHFVSKSYDLLKEREHSMTHQQQEVFLRKWK